MDEQPENAPSPIEVTEYSVALYVTFSGIMISPYLLLPEITSAVWLELLRL